MNVYDSLEAAAVCRHAVIALGTFDGVHVGHRRVMETAMSEGKRRWSSPFRLTPYRS